MSTSPGTRWSYSRAYRAPANPRWRSAHCTPRPSAAISSPFRPMRAGCFIRWPCRRSMRSRACHRPLHSSSSVAHPRHAHPWAASRRCRTCCACSIRGPATIRATSRCCTRRRSPRIPPREPVGNATVWVASTRSPSNRWCRMTLSRSASGPLPPGRRPGAARISATSS